MRKTIGFLPLFFLLAHPAYAFTLSDFEAPESIVADPKNGAYFVSNVNGSPGDKDGNGYISKINANGNIVIQKFIGGKKNGVFLHAPKGLVVVGENLFVADIDVVKAFNKESGKPAMTVDFSHFRVKFLNGITADEKGRIYVSDLVTNQIFRIDTKKNYELTLYKEGKELGSPNGLAINPKSKHLVLVGWESGQIAEIDAHGNLHVLKRGFSRLDGIDYDDQGNLYVSDFERGEIYKIPNYGRGDTTTFLSGLTTPADISCDRKREEILIPSLKGNTITTVSFRKRP